MSEERVVGRGIFIWSDKPTKEYLDMLPLAQLRKDIEVCERCGARINYAWVGVIDEKGFQNAVDYLKDYLAEQDCKEGHHFPGYSKK